MFCRCPNGFGGGPNTQTCPVCLAFPGALPVPNRRAIEETIKLGLALDCTIADRAVFHRKNYFYPDLPKAYQISQYDEPLCADGHLAVPTPDGDVEIGIVRAHLEEDAAKNVHVAASRPDPRRDRDARRLQPRRHAAARDRDRARHPLGRRRQALPPAAAPDGRRARPLGRGAREGLDALRRQRLGAPGRLRRAAHAHRAEEHELVQLRREGDRARDRAADRDLRGGGEVQQETLHFDPTAEDSPPLRSKEEAEDYRYFPEPDLVPVHPPAELVESLRAEVGELPAARIRRIAETLSFYDADVLVTGGLDRLWSAVVDAGADPKETANVLANAFVATGVDPERVNAAELAKLVVGPRRDPARRVRRGARALGRRRLQRRAVPRAEGRQRRRRARPGHRRGHRREPGRGRAVPRRQAGPARLLRRPGDEGDRRHADPRVVSERLREKLAG